MSSADSESTEVLEHRLREVGLVVSAAPVFRKLTGGVSSDIHLVEDGGRRFVVKQALARLKVRDAWYADPARNRIEQDFLRIAAELVPGAVPRVLHADPEEAWFAMEFLGEDWVNWKEDLLAGRVHPVRARVAGGALGRLHGQTWKDAVIRKRFSTLRNFTELRIEPYLLTTAERLPAAREFLHREADHLGRAELALVHGDFSPKNLMFRNDRIQVLDAEVAWFGDPAFDCAFFLTHLHLKAVFLPERADALLGLVPVFWDAYRSELGSRADASLESRVVRLLVGILLARVHGKSPVEYLTRGEQRDWVTARCLACLPDPDPALDAFTNSWRDALPSR
jgi:aminoglycoside phosphotransferase (APT) family kinase protein